MYLICFFYAFCFVFVFQCYCILLFWRAFMYVICCLILYVFLAFSIFSSNGAVVMLSFYYDNN